MDKTTVLGKVHSFALEKFSTKQASSGARIIRGLANANTIDRSKEIVEPKAFKSSLEKYMENPIVFFNHDWDEAIGKVVASKISNKGLEVEIEIGQGFEPADSVWAQIDQGILKSFSIGFRPLRVEYDEESEVLTIKDMELFEVSVVTIPMNRESLFDMVEDRAVGVKVLDNGNYMSFKSAAKALSVTNNPELVSPVEPEVPVETAVETAVEEPVAQITPNEALEDVLKDTALEKALELIATLEQQVSQKDAEISLLQAAKEASDEVKDHFEEELIKAEAKIKRLKIKSLLSEIDFPGLVKTFIVK